jgi:catechol 2,3-dioxygenase-like lactoylglutathione lyase family enzyme
MLDHVSITVSDIAAAEPFYDAIMKALGIVKVGRRDDWLGYGERARAANPERVYISIRKGSKPDDGPPGLRNYHASYYAAFLRDPDGNRIEAVCHHAAK